MAGAFIRIAFTWMLLFMVLQPILGHIDYVLSVIVKSNAEFAAQKAAPDGMLTPAVRSDVIDNLLAVGFEEDDIQISTNTNEPLLRGSEFSIEIQAPRLPMFVYKFSQNQLPTTYFAKTYTTSEYIP